MKSSGPRISDWATGLITLFALWMIAGCVFLPMNDAPSHIANGVIAHKLLHHDAFFASHYLFEPVLVPYWATALWLLLWQNVTTPLVAWKLLIALYVVLLPLACRFVAKTASQLDADPTPDSPPPSPLSLPLLPLGLLTAFHWGYWMGESNYLVGQPVALLGLGLLFRSKRLLSGSFAGFVLLAALSYICHIYALTLLLIAATAWAALSFVGRWLPSLRVRPLRPVQLVGLAWLYALFALAAYFVLFQHGSQANRGSLGFDLSLRRLAHMLIDPFDTPTPPPRLALALLYLGIGVAYVLLQKDNLRTLLASPGKRLAALHALCRPELLFTGLVVLLAAYLGPVSILGPDGSQKEGEIAIRFVLGGFLLVLLSLRWPLVPDRLPRALLAVTLTMFALVQLRSIYTLHRDTDATLRTIDGQILAQIPPHKNVLPLIDLTDGQWRDYLIHRVVNYVVLRDSYSPHVFAVKGQHALRHLPWGDQRDVRNFDISQDEWRYYDYVLLQTDKPTLPPSLQGHVQLIAQAAPFALYRVERPATTPPSALPLAPTP